MTDEAMRIHRALAGAGVASGRMAEERVAAGRVRINDAIATTGQSVDPARDVITVDGRRIVMPKATTWIVLHKPAGVLTTAHDPEGRRTVFDLVPPQPGLTYVGRLDYMTEGLLLLTTDGEAAHRLTHPSAGVERTYVATVRGPVKAAAAELRAGVELEDGPVHPEQVEVTEGEQSRTWDLTLTIREGRHREVRRLCEAVGLEVLRLVRTSFGPVRLGGLAVGAVRALTPKERTLLEAIGPTGAAGARR
ncbi:MAG: pseudouridine synthase [Gemmatimonadaceae bacterium]